MVRRSEGVRHGVIVYCVCVGAGIFGGLERVGKVLGVSLLDSSISDAFQTDQ